MTRVGCFKTVYIFRTAPRKKWTQIKTAARQMREVEYYLGTTADGTKDQNR